MRRSSRSSLVAAVLVGALSGCGSGTRSEEPPTGPSPPASTDTRKPRGASAYSGQTTTGLEGVGPAADATVIGTSGEAVRLSSLWRERPAMLVFYRGHW